MQTVPEITNILVNINMAFLIANRRSSFITSDAPCFLFNAELQWQRLYDEPDWRRETWRWGLPLSPEIFRLVYLAEQPKRLPPHRRGLGS